MTKEEKSKADNAAAGKKEDDKAAAGTKEPETSVIATVEDLEAQYPQLVAEIRDEVLKKVEQCPAKAMKENMPELYERIVADIQGKGGPSLNVPGFLLGVDDPLAGGTLRAYQKQKGFANLRLPYVLPFKDKATRVALENYILRANGSGDKKRAEAARKAMEKCK